MANAGGRKSIVRPGADVSRGPARFGVSLSPRAPRAIKANGMNAGGGHIDACQSQATIVRLNEGSLLALRAMESEARARSPREA